MATGPAWLRAILRAEQMVAGPVNRGANSGRAAAAVRQDVLLLSHLAEEAGEDVLLTAPDEAST